MTWLPSLIGTQMKEISSLLRFLRAWVRSRNRGSWENAGDDSGLAGLDHPSGDALTGLVHATLDLAGGKPVGGLDGDLIGLAVDQRQGAAGHAHVIVEELEDRPDHVAQLHAGVQGLADLKQELEFLDFASDLWPFRGAGHRGWILLLRGSKTAVAYWFGPPSGRKPADQRAFMPTAILQNGRIHKNHVTNQEGFAEMTDHTEEKTRGLGYSDKCVSPVSKNGHRERPGHPDQERRHSDLAGRSSPVGVTREARPNQCGGCGDSRPGCILPRRDPPMM